MSTDDDEYIVIFRRFANGRDARKYGLKAWPIRILRSKYRG